MWDLIVDGVHWAISWIFYGIGRGVTRLIGVARSDSGTPEAMLGFAIFVLVVLALIKLPWRLAMLALAR